MCPGDGGFASSREVGVKWIGLWERGDLAFVSMCLSEDGIPWLSLCSCDI